MKQISIIHQSAENHQGQKILNAPRINWIICKMVSSITIDIQGSIFKNRTILGHAYGSFIYKSGNHVWSITNIMEKKRIYQKYLCFFFICKSFSLWDSFLNRFELHVHANLLWCHRFAFTGVTCNHRSHGTMKKIRKLPFLSIPPLSLSGISRWVE